MVFAHLDHRGEDVVPGLLLLHDRVREHATVPADVLDAALLRVLEPVAGAFDDVELPVRIVGLALLLIVLVVSGWQLSRVGSSG